MPCKLSHLRKNYVFVCSVYKSFGNYPPDLPSCLHARKMHENHQVDFYIHLRRQSIGNGCQDRRGGGPLTSLS